MDKVSVIMPCFNDGEYIAEAVSSVLNQTYPDVQLVIVDDGSTDEKTVKLIENIDAPDILKLKTGGNSGPSAARDMGIRACSGKYILPLDSDDKIEPDYIKKAVEAIENDENIGLVYCHADLFGEESGKWELPDYSLKQMLLNNVVFVTALFSKEDYLSCGGFRTNLEHGLEDYDFFLSILQSGKDIVQLEGTYFHYRIKPASRTTRFKEDISSVKEAYRIIYEGHPALYEKYRALHAEALRDAWVEQTQLIQTLKDKNPLARMFKNVPFVRKLAKKIILK